MCDNTLGSRDETIHDIDKTIFLRNTTFKNSSVTKYDWKKTEKVTKCKTMQVHFPYLTNLGLSDYFGSQVIGQLF